MHPRRGPRRGTALWAGREWQVAAGVFGLGYTLAAAGQLAGAREGGFFEGECFLRYGTAEAALCAAATLFILATTALLLVKVSREKKKSF